MSLAALDIAFDATCRDRRWRFAPVAGPDVARCVVGRSREEAAGLLPRVYNLCGGAHAVAAAAALGLPEPCRDRLSERLRDHAVAVFAEWPALFGGAPDRAALRQLAGTAEDHLALRRHVLGDDVAASELDLARATPAEFGKWLDRAASPTARLMRRLQDTLHPDWGRVELDRPDMADVVAALEDGTPRVARETTAADGWRGAPLIRDLLAREGMSLFVRLLARLLDLLAGLAGNAGPAPDRRPPPGIGFAYAARGLLAHRARVEDGVVVDYRILAPSAWNLAPDGLLARMLAALPTNDETSRLARIAVAAVNPCVPVRLSFERGERRGDA
ncbi:nickel-dependent hydrogenase large subunit [Ancylobacter sp. FA202]|uniref:nickel-dependent hydrogenase large subunit n=1 Tax=Ancylobacter sp. FA202 TaxID=1111106 RepID=UPI0003789304|nr:nickel-dependent hydrogenase large subunit [Ancylobacter sp. FA202]